MKNSINFSITRFANSISDVLSNYIVKFFLPGFARRCRYTAKLRKILVFFSFRFYFGVIMHASRINFPQQVVSELGFDHGLVREN